MKGRDRFSRSEADEIRRLLKRVRRAERGTPQKRLRDQLRAIGFYISDFAGGPAGFTRSDFDELVRDRRVTITDQPSDSTPRGSRPAKPARRRPARTTSARAARRPSSSRPPTADRSRHGSSAALAALATEPVTIKAAMSGGVPDRPGLYALYGSVTTWRELGLGSPPDRRPLYVGKAEGSLVSRDLKTHFANGTTGRSSPRRSFAALLAQTGVLALVAVPRRAHDPEPGKWTHYALETAGDEQLTAWMRRKLRIAVWPSPAGAHLATVEGEVIRRWEPPLNLAGVSTPWTAQVKAARAAMANQAREWAAKTSRRETTAARTTATPDLSAMNGVSIGAVFPADNVDARFVVSMSMAKNDIERALRDALRARRNDDPDFSYRVRLVTGHLVEAVDALNLYSQQHAEVRKLVARVAPEARKHLKAVRSALQKAGPRVLDHIRDHTFHYPSPDPKYLPTSDEELADALRAMAVKRAEVFADFEKREVTLTFADEIALALALGKHSADEYDLRRQLEIARDGALAFRAWAEALGVAYFEAYDLKFGTPEWKDARPDQQSEGDDPPL
jgi:hypothetical protein